MMQYETSLTSIQITSYNEVQNLVSCTIYNWSNSWSGKRL